MELITARLTDIAHQIEANKEFLASKIRYGDRQVEMLVTLATDQMKSLTARVQKLEDDKETRSSRSLTIALAVVGWVIAIVTIATVVMQ